MGTDTLVPTVLFVSLAVTVLGIARIISEGRTRRRLIDSGNSAEVARSLGDLGSAEERLAGALKWGIVAIAAGIALVTIQFLPYERDEPIVLGILLLFVGAGMLAYYMIGRRRKPGA
jgi:hypothetical protein